MDAVLEHGQYINGAEVAEHRNRQEGVARFAESGAGVLEGVATVLVEVVELWTGRDAEA